MNGPELEMCVLFAAGEAMVIEANDTNSCHPSASDPRGPCAYHILVYGRTTTSYTITVVSDPEIIVLVSGSPTRYERCVCDLSVLSVHDSMIMCWKELDCLSNCVFAGLTRGTLAHGSAGRTALPGSKACHC